MGVGDLRVRTDRRVADYAVVLCRAWGRNQWGRAYAHMVWFNQLGVDRRIWRRGRRCDLASVLEVQASREVAEGMIVSSKGRSALRSPVPIMKFVRPALILMFLCFAVVGCGRSEPWDEPLVSQSLAIGREITAEIEKWRTAHDGVVPASLEELAGSGYVVRPPVAGTKKWVYGVREDGSFQLSFQVADNYPCAYYDSRIGEWRVDQ